MPALRAVWQNRSRFSKAKTLRAAWCESTSCWQSWPKVEAITKAQRQSLDAALAQLNETQLKVVFGALLGDAYVRAGFVDHAEQIAAVITPLVDTNNSEQLGYLHLLQGDIALLRG
jgi:lipopolysaccharide biosynthesis regulator YciM